jgi:hypothetical protein
VSGQGLFARRDTGSTSWYKVTNPKNSSHADELFNATGTYLWEHPFNRVRFKTGGLADFTGPAWLDGTKSRPEIVLNQRDSANFIQLRDILSEALDGASKGDKKSSGDNYFDIDVNVEKIDNDYDVERIADKIRRMIYDDASYRNVNAVNLIR